MNTLLLLLIANKISIAICFPNSALYYKCISLNQCSNSRVQYNNIYKTSWKNFFRIWNIHIIHPSIMFLFGKMFYFIQTLPIIEFGDLILVRSIESGTGKKDSWYEAISYISVLHLSLRVLFMWHVDVIYYIRTYVQQTHSIAMLKGTNM